VKHYLNTELRGKTGADGNLYFPVYVRFSINSQTYKYRSQLVRRPLSLEQYQRLEEMYKGDISVLLHKEREIISHVVQSSISNGKFIQKTFKDKFIFSCRSVINILKEVEISLPITKWDKNSLNWDLFGAPNLELIDPDLNSGNGVDKITHIHLMSIALKYQMRCAKRNDMKGLMLMHDWKNDDSNLKGDFFVFLENETTKSERNELHEYMRSLKMI
jgi:hypothetical protein